MNFDDKILQEAWDKVKKNNALGGIDQQSVQDFYADEVALLQKIKLKLTSQTYLPQPYLQIKIKKDQHEHRSLGLATVADKIVQQAITTEMQQRLDSTFLNSSYAYRKDKGALKALQRLKHLIINEKNEFIIKCDIDNFFDTLPHDRLQRIIKPIIADDYILQLVLTFCKMGYIERGTQWKDRKMGVPQGAILSPLLSNIYLHSLDQKMANKNYAYLRYADDFVILSKNKDEAQEILLETQNYIKEKLHLQLNKDNYIKSINEGFKFLGVWINNEGFYLKKEKIEKIKSKIEKSLTLPDYSKKYHETIAGIKNYYAKIIPEHYLFPIDEYQKEIWIKKTQHNKTLKTKKMAYVVLQEIEFVTDHFSQNKDFHIKEITNLIIASHTNHKINNAEEAVKKRKREYELKEFENHEIVVGGFGKTLGISKNQCTIKMNGKLIQKVPLQNVEHISIQTEACSISSKLVIYCAKNKIPIDFTGFSGEPEARIYDTMNDMYELWHKQFLHLFSPEAIFTANALIYAKINNQKKLVQYFSKYAVKKEPDLKDALETALPKLKNLTEKVKTIHSDSLEKHREKLINIEAQASLIYWELIRLMIDEETDFEHRAHKGAKDLVNSMLNYGYSILYRHVWTSILQQGLNPSFSYIHVPRKYEGTLIFDMIEPFRQPIVDRAIISLINKKTQLEIKNGRLEEQTKQKVIMAVNDRLRRYDTYLGERKTLFNIIKKQALHFVQHLEQPEIKFKPYQISKW